MIKEIRYDFLERKLKRKNGEVYKVIPAHHDCTYYFEDESGRKFVIAKCWSTDDTLYLNAEHLAKWNQYNIYKGASLEGEYLEVFAELFEKLGIDENTQISEYFNI